MRRRTDTPEAAGWYPDEATGRLRRWDGRVWTGETREMPPWMGGAPAPQEPGAGGPAPRRRIGRHWIALGAVVGVLFVGISVKAWNSGPDLPPRTVFDQEFVATANAKCRASLTPLKEERPKPGTPEGRDPGPNEAVAARVDETADALVGISDDLRRIAVAPDDAADVKGWLDDWVAYADVGHRYADAVREESRRQEGLVREGAVLARRADGFARANGLRDCTHRFYRDVLGLAVYREYGDPPDAGGVVYFTGGGFLEVAGRSDKPAGANVALWLQVRDLLAVYQELHEQKVPILQPPETMPWGLKEMWIADPDGVRIAVIEVPEDHPLRRRA